MNGRIAIVGAETVVGGAVLRLLRRSDIPVRVLLREWNEDLDTATNNPHDEVALIRSWETPTLTKYLEGVSTLFFCSIERISLSISHLESALEAARHQPGIRIVFISLQNANSDSPFMLSRDFACCEELIRGSGIPYTILRRSPLIHDLGEYVNSDHALRGPAEDGRIAAIWRGDVALAAVKILQHSGAFTNETLTITGPESLSMTDVAEVLSSGSAKPIHYDPQTVEAALAPQCEQDTLMAQYALGAFRAVADGEFAQTTDDFRRITGSRALSVSRAYRTSADDHQVNEPRSVMRPATRDENSKPAEPVNRRSWLRRKVNARAR